MLAALQQGLTCGTSCARLPVILFADYADPDIVRVGTDFNWFRVTNKRAMLPSP